MITYVRSAHYRRVLVFACLVLGGLIASGCGSTELDTYAASPTSSIVSTTQTPTTTKPTPTTTITTTIPAPPETTAPPETAPPATVPVQVPAPAAQEPQEAQGRCGGNLPPCWVMMRESGGNPMAVNPTGCGGRGCFGLFQFDPTTWDSTAASMGRPDLVGNYLPPESDQDAVAAYLWAAGAGCAHWNAC